MVKFTIFVICIVTFEILFILIKLFIDKKMSSDRTKSIGALNVIRQPKAFLFVGVAGLIVFSALAFFVLFAPASMLADFDEDMRVPYAVLLFVFCLPYVIFLLFRLIWRIEVKEDSFMFRNVFGKKKEYGYDDIVVKQTRQGAKIYLNDKRIVNISYFFENWFAFETALSFYKSKKDNIEIEQE